MFKHATQSSTVRITDARYEIVTLGFKTNVEPYQVVRVIGNDPVRQFLTAAPGGRFQVQEASYDPETKAWLNVYGNEDRRPGEFGHWTGRGMNWNSQCAECHNTHLQKNYDESTDTYHTTMAEMSVSCEACHGPLKAHGVWRTAHPDPKLTDPTVAPMPPGRMLAVCASCHSRRTDLTGDFKPGDSFFDHYSLEILDDSERWYPDGQIKDEDYEFTSFVSSKMHERGVTCQDCHNPHSAKPILLGNDLCMRCHNGSFTNAPVIIPAAHGHHNLADLGGQCVNCHMPTTVYMQRQARHDHGFTIPDPLLTRELQIPNACNRCHSDKSVDWAIQNTDQWYRDKMKRHARERAEWIVGAEQGDEAVRDKLMGMLSTESPYWRAVAASFLYQWGTNSVVSRALIDRLKDNSPLVREQAARSLEPLLQAGDGQALTALTPLLSDTNRNVRVATGWVLRATVDLNSGTGLELLTALDTESDQPRGQFQKAMLMMSRQQPAQALEHLQKALAWDPYSPPLRAATAAVLRQTGHSKEADDIEANGPRPPGTH